MALDHIKTQEKRARDLFEAGSYAASETVFRDLVTAAPKDASARYNLGVCLAKLGRFEEALAAYRSAIELSPAFVDAYTNFGVCLNELNLISQARQAFAIAHSLAPDNPIPILNEGIAALALGDFEAGWQGFAARWQLPLYAQYKRMFDVPVWKGEELFGKTLFLYAEQGFGDTLQMARYIPILATRGARIVIEVPPALKKLIQNVRGVYEVLAKGDALPSFDFYCALMDVPGVLGTTLATIPSACPYVFADPAHIVSYQKLLEAKNRKRVGLSWAGRTSHENDRNRSLPFSAFDPVRQHTDAQFISLQRSVADTDKEPLAQSGVLPWGAQFVDFSYAAAAIMALDLVITVDTSVAHLAGALGKPVWILLPFYADWRWLVGRNDSPWYPSATLFRQKKRGEWRSVINQVEAALRTF